MSLADAIQHEQIQAWGKDISPKPERRSASIGKLIEALAKAQLKFEVIKKETTNPFYKSKYADLSAVIAATQPALAAEGLVVLQEPITENGKAGVVTTLAHSSGEWREHTLLLPTSKSDAQGIGSAVTYARRYSYQAVVGVAAELDDDANATLQTKHHEDAFENRSSGEGRIKQFQVNAFLTTCAENGKTEKQISAWLKTLGKVQAEELTPEEFQKGLKWAHGKEELTETLTNSVKSARAKKEKFNEGLASLSQTTAQTMITDEDAPF